MSTITYVTGDATQPVGDGEKIIAHVCNDQGGWGSGFVVALSRRWTAPEEAYREWYRRRHSASARFELGMVQFARVAPDIVVANMIAQRGIRHNEAAPPAIDYDALRECLRYVGSCARGNITSPVHAASVHAPRIGCGLGGGDWATVEGIITHDVIDRYGVSFTVYDLPTGGRR